MIEAISKYGPKLKPLSHHELRVLNLRNEFDYTNKLMKGHKDARAKYDLFHYV